MEQLKIGDVVKLNSGSDKMTISYVIGDAENMIIDNALKHQGFDDGDVMCQWSYNHEIKKEVFKKNILTKCNKEE
jgi:uncharacterized protein YodC (DUF2158 family)